jgi:branched-chain amino acid aminotransferase
VAGNLGQSQAHDGHHQKDIFVKTIYLDGRYLSVHEQIIENFAPGSFTPKGVFETMLAKNSFVMDTALHLARLKKGLEVLGIKQPFINPLILKEVVSRNKLSTARVRIMVWQSPSLKPNTDKEIHVMVVALPYKAPAKKNYRVCFLKTNRPAEDKLAEVKSLDYGLFAESYAYAQAHGFDEALLFNRKGRIFEASRSNIFWMKGKLLFTPPLSSGCLNGITRRQVIAQAKSLKITVEEKDLTLEILRAADAAFLTNSLMGIKPIDLPSSVLA